ncbi:hypothetical protein [Alteromonas sp.]|jgi:hypothetical protein|uniref:hypothetical protein n=1 Tax=Alteromonas sp. TaxID=232 RepID=UPI003ADD800E|tara:strand:+ start:213 stop:431 length:219 start_codon:yes stop_codon:yes gene_type:complete
MTARNFNSTHSQLYPRQYTLITVKGARKLACYIEEEWVIDSTCKCINELLALGLIGEEAITGWVNLQPCATQ